MKTIAIDWSGAKSGERRKIWLAEVEGGRLLRVECGRSRDAVAEHLIDLIRHEPEVIVGFDFAFSLPAWFLRERKLGSVADLWREASTSGEDWLVGREWPFWGSQYGRRREFEEPYRRSDKLLPQTSGIRPKSVFQAGGSGSVGTGSVRGWPVLHRLKRAGFSIWPFDTVSTPLVVEIYPRILTGAINKSSAADRQSYLQSHYPELLPEHTALAASSDDAFDSAVSALVMARHAGAMLALPRVTDPVTLLEGVIWHPNMTTAEYQGR